MLFQGQEFGAIDAVSVFRGPQDRSSPRRCGRDAASSSRSFRASRSAEMQDAPAGAGRSRRLRALQAGLGRKRDDITHMAPAASRISSRCAATMRRSFAGRRRRRRSGARRPRRSCCAIRRRAPRDERLLVVNLGLRLAAAIVRRAADRAARRIRAGDVRWSSEHPDYGGAGTPDTAERRDGWRIPATSAVVLRPAETR